MEELLRYLNSVYPMSIELREHLINVLKSKELSRKDYLLKAGHVCHNIYWVQKGVLRLFYLKNEADISTWFLKEGDIAISVKSFFHQNSSTEFIQALENVEVWYISYQELLKCIEKFPEFLMISWLITQKYYIISEQKQEPLRMARAQDKYHYLLEHLPELLLRIPSKYLASYLGINETTLSKIKKWPRK